jgi:hypothetical protein
MFFHLLYIHLFRPFLKYHPSTSPLPSHVSPRKLSTQAACFISKLMRLYKRTYGLRQICNIAVYMVHSACTIHLLNLPEKTAKRDMVHGVKHLEEIAEDWLCARRTLSILSVLARKWKIELPEEASTVLARTDAKYGNFSTADVPSPRSDIATPSPSAPVSSPQHTLHVQTPQKAHNQFYPTTGQNYAGSTTASMGNVGGMLNGAPNKIGRTLFSRVIVSKLASSLPPDSAFQIATPYQQRAQYIMPDSVPSTLAQQQNVAPAISSAAPSPSMMFGGVDALVESQNWWLRDQASLAVGFENWVGIEGTGEGNGISGASDAFYLPGTGNGTGTGNNNMNGNGYGEGEWFS